MAEGLGFCPPATKLVVETTYREWHSRASIGVSERGCGGVSSPESNSWRRPEFGRGWVRRYSAREKELVVATHSWCCAEHNGELGFEPLWL